METTRNTYHLLTDEERAILVLWNSAYAAWEDGDAHSPSATDLVLLACGYLASQRGLQMILPADDLDNLADMVYSLQCDGYDSTSLVGLVVPRIPR